jgi:trehalose utilization protein
MPTNKIRVTIWNEFRHEREDAPVKKVYPDGMHAVIAQGIAAPDLEIRTATLDEPEHGLTDAVLANTDVLTWWGHKAHGAVQDDIAKRVQQHVLNGMGFVGLHAAHMSKPFRLLMGTHCSLKWREANEKERLWTIEPAHPVAEGLPEHFELPEEEMYGERFDIPTPDELVFISWFQGGEVFRSGCCWQRGHGRVFYFRPGHETHPTYYDKNVQRVIGNACRWARRRVTLDGGSCPNAKQALEPVPGGK